MYVCMYIRKYLIIAICRVQRNVIANFESNEGRGRFICKVKNSLLIWRVCSVLCFRTRFALSYPIFSLTAALPLPKHIPLPLYLSTFLQLYLSPSLPLSLHLYLFTTLAIPLSPYLAISLYSYMPLSAYLHLPPSAPTEVLY